MKIQELMEIEKRCAFAQSGPWFFHENDLIGGYCVMPEDAPPSSGAHSIADFSSAVDADFIAHARTDIPELCAEVRRLRKRIKGIQKYIEDLEE